MRKMLSFAGEAAALLLVDLQEEQRHHSLYRVSGFDRVLGNCAQLIRAARANRHLVIHAAYRRDFASHPPRPFEPTTPDGAPSFSDAADPMTAICAEVAPHPGETIIHKNDASAFCEGTLKPLLAGHGIGWLVVAGVWTEACVAASVRDATANGFRVLLVKDACGSGTEAMHQTAILDLANRLYGGAVTDTLGAAALMTGEPVEAWIAERPVPILYDFSNAAEHYGAL
jgi:maleamate amidohydrolase